MPESDSYPGEVPSHTVPVDWAGIRASLTVIEGAERAEETVTMLADVVRGDGHSEEVMETLWDHVWHQGSIYPYSIPVIPAFVSIAGTAGHPIRGQAGRLVVAIGESALRTRCSLQDTSDDEEPEFHQPPSAREAAVALAARDTITAHQDTFLDWLRDSDLRRPAIALLGLCSPNADDLVPLLQAELSTEPEPSQRVALVAAVINLTVEKPPHHRAAVRDWLAGLVADSTAVDRVEVRVAAALVLLIQFDQAPTAELIDAVVAGADHPDTILELGALDEICPLGWYERGSTATILCHAFHRHRDARFEVAGRLARSPHAHIRANACEALFDIAATWHSPTEQVVRLLASALTDTATEVRRGAANCLSALGEFTTAVADDLAIALGDADSDVREHAGRALAFQGDARVIEPIRRWLTDISDPDPAIDDQAPPFARVRRRLPWVRVSCGQRFWRGMRQHAAELLPALMGRLEADSAAELRLGDLLDAINAWGPDAADAVHILPGLLPAHDVEYPQIIAALAAIGEPALAQLHTIATNFREVPADCRARAHDAHQRLTRVVSPDTLTPAGEADLARRLSTPDRTWGCHVIVKEALDEAITLGPSAAPLASLIEPLMTHTNVWIKLAAIRAYWASTGDSATTLAALAPFLRSAGDDGIGTAGLSAVSILGEIGPAAVAYAPTMRALLDSDRRINRGGGQAVLHNLEPLDDSDERADIAAVLAAITASPSSNGQ